MAISALPRAPGTYQHNGDGGGMTGPAATRCGGRGGLPGTCVLIGVLLFGSVAVAAESRLAWAPLAGLDDTTRLHLSHLRRARCLPPAAEVTVPVYPQAVVTDLAWGRMAPECERRKGWRQLGAVTLVTADPFTDVLAWYGVQLDDYHRYEDGGRSVYLRAAIDDFLWERDYHKYPNIVVQPADPAWHKAGYRTVIELNRPAPRR